MGGVVIRGGRGGSGAGGGNGTVTCLANVQPGVVSQNLSSLTNVVDWLAFGATIGANNQFAAITSIANTHAKKDGPGWLADSNLQLVAGGVSLTNLSQTGSTTITTTASDSSNTAAYNSTNGVGFHTPGSGLGWGWRLGLFVPGDNVARKFTMFGNQHQCAMRLSAQLYDGAGTSHTSDGDTGAGNTRQMLWEVTYKSPVATWLRINALVITNHVTTSNFKIQAMAIQV